MIGGEFSAAGNAAATNVVLWNGNEWQALGRGLNGWVRALCTYNGDLIAAGHFTLADGSPVNRIARWDGATWSALGSGIEGAGAGVFALDVHNGELIVGGLFSSAGGLPVTNIARWDGNGWERFELGGTETGLNGYVLSLLEFDGELVAGGSFTTGGGALARYVARWTPSGWQAFGAGINPQSNLAIKDVASFAGQLFVAGSAGSGSGGYGVQFRWDGSSWQQMPLINAYVADSLCEFDGQLFIGGYFGSVGVLRWTGNSWQLDNSMIVDGSIRTMSVFNGSLVVAGGISSAGGVICNSIARWDGEAWHALAPGLDNWINSMVPYGEGIAAGGRFTRAGNIPANHVGLWNGDEWQPLGDGINGEVSDLIVFNGHLFAASSIGVQRWDGSSWITIAGGNSYVSCLAVYDGELIVGGGFTSINGVNASRIARWNGATWSPLGAGLDSTPWCLRVHEGSLVAAGYFLTAGGASAPGIARWNGATWSPLPGLDRTVHSLGEYNGDLIAGGAFRLNGLNYIARWDGTAWQPLGSGTGPGTSARQYVNALATYHGRLIAGGNFFQAGGLPAQSIAAWDGTGWLPLGSGMDPSSVNCLLTLHDTLFAGGSFVTADGIASARIARWIGPSADFNHDGDSGTDLDIQDFFACLGGHCCPTCGTADFDCDGDSGTDADIESFFRAMSGGAC